MVNHLAALCDVIHGERWRARHFALVGLVGVGLGAVVGGGGGRLVMKILALAAPDRVAGQITENGNRIGEFTLGGTIELVIFGGALAGGMGAVVYLISEPWLRWTRRAVGGAFALLLLAMGSTFALDPQNRDFLLVTNQPLAFGLFASLFVIFGFLLPPGVGVLDRLLPAPDGPKPWGVAAPYLGVLGFGWLFVPLTVYVVLFEGFPLAGAFGITMGLATAAVWWAHCSPREDYPYVRAAQAVGYFSLAGAVVTGAIHLSNDLADIL